MITNVARKATVMHQKKIYAAFSNFPSYIPTKFNRVPSQPPSNAKGPASLRTSSPNYGEFPKITKSPCSQWSRHLYLLKYVYIAAVLT